MTTVGIIHYTVYCLYQLIEKHYFNLFLKYRMEFFYRCRQLIEGSF